MQNIIETEKASTQSLQINWQNLVIVSSFHVLAVVALFYFSWANLAVMLIFNWLVASLGIGIGYHRLLTHRSFKVSKWLEYGLTILGSLAIQDGAIKWVTTHRIHHAYTEEEQDPHSTRESFTWAHVGWVLLGRAQEHDLTTCARYVPDLMKDKFHVIFSRYYYVSTIILGVLLFAVGGWSMVFWGIFLRTVIGWHSTWIVNSVTHFWGTRRFMTQDDSTNNGLVAFFSFGEGWHNNHHAHPTSARHGLTWYEFDQNWLTIRLFQKLGWAKQVKIHNLPDKETN
ncbi:MAG: fatty acid desaturase [Pyrinomonadaceae bacterium]